MKRQYLIICANEPTDNVSISNQTTDTVSISPGSPSITVTSKVTSAFHLTSHKSGPAISQPVPTLTIHTDRMTTGLNVDTSFSAQTYHCNNSSSYGISISSCYCHYFSLVVVKRRRHLRKDKNILAYGLAFPRENLLHLFLTTTVTIQQ